VSEGTHNVTSADEETAEEAPKKPKAPVTRRPLSGVELETRFEDWRDERRGKQAARTPEDDARRMRRGLSTVMGAGILALAVASALTGQGFEASQARNDDRIAQLESQMQKAQVVPVDADLSGKMTRLSEAAARDAGKVADAQQVFSELHHRASTEPNADNGTPNAAMLQIVEHRKTLAPLFDEGTYLADDKEAYSPTSMTPFNPSTEIDPRFAWYVRYDGAKASPPGAYVWSVETVMPDLDATDASGATRTAQVVWLCREVGTGQVLAWANANYISNGGHGTFKDLEVVVTAAGDEHQQGAGKEPSAPKVPEISGPGTGMTDENREGS
jgi:hypothetical protein